MVLPGLKLGFIETAKTTILSGFAALPYLLVIFTGFFGGITGNLGLAILFIGQIILVPLLQFILIFFRNQIASNDGLSKLLRLDPIGKLDPTCSLVPDLTRRGNFQTPPISDWVAQVVFFFTFLITNGITIYNLKPTEGAKTEAKDNRQFQAIISLIFSVVTGLAFLALYYNINKCESRGSILFGLIIYILLGIGWFSFASSCGMTQADILGIASKMHTIAPGTDEYPNVCVPIKNQTCNPECLRTSGRANTCKCDQASQCASGFCIDNLCANCNDAKDKVKGCACNADTECKSNTCKNGKCA